MDVHASGPLDRPARVEFARHDERVTALALINTTPLSRMSSNFFIRGTRPETPTRLFEDEVSAVAWLSGFLP